MYGLMNDCIIIQFIGVDQIDDQVMAGYFFVVNYDEVICGFFSCFMWDVDCGNYVY